MNAYALHDNIPEAESLLQTAIPKIEAGEILGSLTPCFNVLLRAHARRNNLSASQRTYEWMKSAQAQVDAHSFAAVIKVLTRFRRFRDALHVLRVDMRNYRTRPSAFHYATIMQGLCGNTDWDSALALYREMLKRGIKSSVTTDSLYLKAKTWKEAYAQGRAQDVDNDESFTLEESIQELENILEHHDKEGSAASYQISGLINDPDTSPNDPSPFFDDLIYVHGRHRCFDAVKALFARYMDVKGEKGLDESKLPIGLTSALMSAHWHAGEYDQVEQYWNLAKDRADEFAPPTTVPSFRYLVAEDIVRDTEPLDLHPSSEPYPGPELEPSQTEDVSASAPHAQTLLTNRNVSMKVRPAPGRRHVLNRPLQWYLAALNSQSRIIDSITTVSRLLAQGYTLDRMNWNNFICHLLESTPPLALIAFVLTDRFLTPNFPGWARGFKAHAPQPRRARAQGLQHMKARYVDRRQLMPQYRTLVRLGAALLDIRKFEVEGRRGMVVDVPPELRKFIGTTREIRRMAAKTVNIVQSMPYIATDPLQEKLLRRRERAV